METSRRAARGWPAMLITERIGAGGMGSVYLAKRDRGDFEHIAADQDHPAGPAVRAAGGPVPPRAADSRPAAPPQHRPAVRWRRDRGWLALHHHGVCRRPAARSPGRKTPKPRSEQRIDKLLQACAAVSFAHANLIVHRDITPSNVMVTNGGRREADRLRHRAPRRRWSTSAPRSPTAQPRCTR